MTTEQTQLVEFLLSELEQHVSDEGTAYLGTLRFVLGSAHGAAAHAPKQRRRRKAEVVPPPNVIQEVRSS